MLTEWEMAGHLAAALGFGAAIGLERQWRARMAGPRTNALVAGGGAEVAPGRPGHRVRAADRRGRGGPDAGGSGRQPLARPAPSLRPGGPPVSAVSWSVVPDPSASAT
ncbi:MgtC/SapB family protein [Streptomyces avidinii]